MRLLYDFLWWSKDCYNIIHDSTKEIIQKYRDNERQYYDKDENIKRIYKLRKRL
jgi:hypothetical protein